MHNKVEKKLTLPGICILAVGFNSMSKNVWKILIFKQKVKITALYYVKGVHEDEIGKSYFLLVC
jgi:hypothetical protein